MINALDKNINYPLVCKWYPTRYIQNPLTTASTTRIAAEPVFFRARIHQALKSQNQQMVTNISTEVETASIETRYTLDFNRDDKILFEEKMWVITSIDRHVVQDKEKMIGFNRLKYENIETVLSLIKVQQ